MMNSLDYVLPAGLATVVEQALIDWQENDKVPRLWGRDSTLWSDADEAQWLGWLSIVEEMQGQLDELEIFSEQISREGFTHAVLLGMGGSSMAPEVLQETFAAIPGKPGLLVLDSTDPVQVKATEDAVDLEHSLFIVASKSGGTLEPNILKARFFQRMVETVGIEKAPAHFIAITDPGSSLDQLAGKEKFRKVFYGVPEIGGRFSALSNFGMVPAAIIGIDVARFLDGTLRMVKACGAAAPAMENPGVVLGCILGTAAESGRDKLTIITSRELSSIGAWLEQLVAESTGKQGKGIIPVDGEAVGPPAVYGDDRIFVYVRLQGASDTDQDKAFSDLESAGHPVIRINVTEKYNLGQELFRWEIATAVAGSILGVNPFDQPDVEASKIETRKITGSLERGGHLPEQTPLAREGGITLYTDAHNKSGLLALTGKDAGVAEILNAHLERAGAGDYVALLAYLARDEVNHAGLQLIRHHIRDTRQVATCLGFGPRFLHSTGQYFKGGPNRGVFLQITCDAGVDLPVPGHQYTFGLVEAAQAQGDFEVLAGRGRRVLRVHLGTDVMAGLAQLGALIQL